MSARPSDPALAPGLGGPGQTTILCVEANADFGGELVEQLRADGYGTATPAPPSTHECSPEPVRIQAVLLGSLEGPRAMLDLLEEIRAPTFLSAEAIWDENLPRDCPQSRRHPTGPVAGLRGGRRRLHRHRTSPLPGAACPLEGSASTRSAVPSRLYSALEPCVSTRALTRSTSPGCRSSWVASSMSCSCTWRVIPTAVCSKQELLRAIWRQRCPSETRTVDSHASRLRRKLHAAGALGFVVNVWGVGYRLL